MSICYIDVILVCVDCDVSVLTVMVSMTR